MLLAKAPLWTACPSLKTLIACKKLRGTIQAQRLTLTGPPVHTRSQHGRGSPAPHHREPITLADYISCSALRNFDKKVRQRRAQQLSAAAPRSQRDFKKHPAKLAPGSTARLGCWNVRTLNVTGKAEELVHVLEEYRLQACGLAEVRWPGAARKRVGKWTFLHSGRPASHPRPHEHGVALALSPAACAQLQDWSAVSERLLTARLKTAAGGVTILVAYAPPCYQQNRTTAEAFYELLQEAVDDVPPRDTLLLLGDFNAKVDGGPSSFHPSTGKQGVSRPTCDNGELLLGFSASNELAITGTWFQHPDLHKVTWRSADQATQNQIDHILVRRSDLPLVHDTRVFRKPAAIGTDHDLVVTKLRMRFPRRRRQQGPPRFDTAKLRDKEVRDAYQRDVQVRLRHPDHNTHSTPEAMCAHLTEALAHSAKVHLAAERRQAKPWLQQDTLQAVATKQELWQRWRGMCGRTRSQTAHAEPAKQAYKAASRRTRALVARDKRLYLAGEVRKVQQAQDRGDPHAAHAVLRRICGPSGRPPPQLRSAAGTLLRTPQLRTERWFQHNSELFAQRPPVTASIPSQPAPSSSSASTPTWELPPSREEVRAAMRQLRNHSSAGVDGIPPELVKYGGEALLDALHELITASWTSASAPTAFKRDVLIVLPKKGADPSICSNHRSIALQNVAGKVYSAVLKQRLEAWAELQLMEAQCGFRAGRGCQDALFSMRLLQEEALEKNTPLYVAFLDITGAFDAVRREHLWDVLAVRGCPPLLLAAIRDLHQDHQCAVRAELISNWFPVHTGVKQGCKLAPSLFCVYLDTALREVLPKLELTGVRVSFSIGGERCDTRNLSGQLLLWILLYADDIALIADSEQSLQSAVSELDAALQSWQLLISVTKSKVMVVSKDAAAASPVIQLQGQTLEAVQHFKYLGSQLSGDGTLDAEISYRISCGAAAFQRLKQHGIWRDRGLSLGLRVALYRTLVLSALLYCCETWALSEKLCKRLEVFQMGCLRYISGTRLLDHTPNDDIRESCRVQPITAVLRERRLRWLGVVARMGTDRIPKQMLFGEIEGKRSVGRPRRTWKSTVQLDRSTIPWPGNPYSSSHISITWFQHCQNESEWLKLIRSP